MAFRPSGGAALPRTFRCRVCGEEKAPASFSKSQLQKWYNKKRNDQHNTVTPESVGLSCKDHGNDEREIRCHGPCDRVKVVEHFSKRQRNDPAPWCIDCTEWRLSFDGGELPTAIPNGTVADYEYDEVEDDQAPLSFDSRGEDNEDDDSDDDYDEFGNPYNDPTPVSDLLDRLEGYDKNDAGKDTTADAVSTTGSVDISCWGEYTNDGRSDAGSSHSARTVTGMHSSDVQSRRTLVDNSNSQGYRPVTGSTMTLSAASTVGGIASHLSRLAVSPGMNYHTQHSQAGQAMVLGEGTQTLSNQVGHTRPRAKKMSDEEIKNMALALVNEAPKPSKSTANTKNQGSKDQKSNSQWYKGSQHQAHLGSGTLPNHPGAHLENATVSESPPTSSVASSVAGESDHPTQSDPSSTHEMQVQKDLTIPAQTPTPQPSSEPREFSTDLMEQIRRVIRQECKYLPA
ncbi:hypothetical protein NUW58_g5247 [Xylaria curta]|uniref:Uncharacterized protein n=1 Tax=Xylaria curta TaxID=42375 RepID=A0ACC1P5H7_9PEZI|nr:hypothetical protein NUW58_g5247 [Xylaria curta]